MYRQNGRKPPAYASEKGHKVGENRRETAETGEIVGGELQQWSQLPNESAAGLCRFHGIR